MSTQSEREAAARRFDASARRTEDENTFGAVINVQGSGWFLPNGMDSNRVGGLAWDDIVGSWVVHVRALDAKPAPVDALEGVVWETPRQVAEWGEQPGGRGHLGHRNFGVSFKDSAISDRLINTGVATMSAIAAHARAQLAREADEAAPVQPAALTLEQARAMCREAGDTVVEAEWVSAPAVLRYCDAVEAWGAAQDAERAAFMALCEEDRRKFSDGIADPPTVAGTLRALGVTPAVLSAQERAYLEALMERLGKDHGRGLLRWADARAVKA